MSSRKPFPYFYESQMGFGLIELLIGVGISIVVGLGISTVVIQGISSHSTLKQRVEAQYRFQEAQILLKKSSECTSNFSDFRLETPNLQTNPLIQTEKLESKGTSFIDPSIGHSSGFQKIQVKNFRVLCAAKNEYLADMEMDFNVKGHQYLKSLPLYVNTDPTGKIVNCTSDFSQIDLSACIPPPPPPAPILPPPIEPVAAVPEEPEPPVPSPVGPASVVPEPPVEITCTGTDCDSGTLCVGDNCLCVGPSCPNDGGGESCDPSDVNSSCYTPFMDPNEEPPPCDPRDVNSTCYTPPCDPTDVNSNCELAPTPPQRSCDLEGYRSKLPTTGTPKASAIVDYSYCLFYGRDPEPLGRGYWKAMIARGGESGVSTADLINTFYSSGEFSANVDHLSDEAYVDYLYQNLFQRSADDGGRTYWANQVKANGRKAVFDTFIQSPEFAGPLNVEKAKDSLAPEVKFLYQRILKRNPVLLTSDEGVGFWIALRTIKKFGSGYTIQRMAIDFSNQEEFRTLFIPTGSLTPSQAVKLAYKFYLQRPADQEGFSFWLNHLNKKSGSKPLLTPLDFVKGLAQEFILSSEFKDRHPWYLPTQAIEE